jgi:hypothetical protein
MRSPVPDERPEAKMSAGAVIILRRAVERCRNVVRTIPTLLSRMRRLRVLMLVVALLVVAKSGFACGCLPIEIGQDGNLAVSVAAEFSAIVAVSDAADSDPIPVDSTPKSSCKHCCCQQPSLPPSMVHLVSFAVLPAAHLQLPAPDSSNWATSPFRPPITTRLA